jgi:site-specific DNA-methyltransferase (adenine-specific)
MTATRIPSVIAQRYEARVPLAALTPHPANPNSGDAGLVGDLITANDFATPVLAQESTGLIIDGETRWIAAGQIGMTELPVVWLEVDDDTRDRLLASLNEATRRGLNDEGKLVALLEGIAHKQGTLDGTAFDAEDLDALVRRLNGPPPDPGDPDDVPPAPATPVTRTGDLWLLGDHRLLVGDARDPAVIARLMGGELADCLWTDPPYGLNYVGGNRRDRPEKLREAGELTVRNDDKAGLDDLLARAFAAVTPALIPGAPVYVSGPPGPLGLKFWQAFLGAGWTHRQMLIWVKQKFALGHSDYHYQHEPIWFGYTPGEGRLGRGAENWYGDNSQTSVFAIDAPCSGYHPNDLSATMKPVDLVARCLENSCPPAGKPLDPFAGSGSTIIAAHRLGMSGYAAEIDEPQADVIIQRWVTYSGQDAHREDGFGWPGAEA